MGSSFCGVLLTTQKTRRPDPLQVWSSFCNSCFRQFSYIYGTYGTLFNVILFNVIISNQPYWSYHGFLCFWGGKLLKFLKVFQKKCWVFVCYGGISTQADTMTNIFNLFLAFFLKVGN